MDAGRDFHWRQRTTDMRNMMAISFVGYSGAVLVLLPAFGNHGLWASLLIFLALRGLTLATYYTWNARLIPTNASHNGF